MATTNTTEAVVGSPNALQHAVHRFGRVDLYDSSHTANIDTEFQTGRTDQTGKGPVSQFVLHLLPRFGGEGTVMNTDLEVGCHALQASGKCLRVASAVHEHQTRRLRSQDVAEVAIGRVLLGAQRAFHAVDFVFWGRVGRFHRQFGGAMARGDERLSLAG